jgi:hypothetical protein
LEIRSLKYEIDELKRETAELRKETRSFRLSPTHTSRMVSSIDSFEFFCSHYTLSLKAGIHHSMQLDLPSGELKQDCYTGVGHIAQTFVTNLYHDVGFFVGITETLQRCVSLFKKNMDPLFDSDTVVSIDIQANYFFFYFLFRPSTSRGQFFHYTYLTSNHAFAFCITPIVPFDCM